MKTLNNHQMIIVYIEKIIKNQRVKELSLNNYILDPDNLDTTKCSIDYYYYYYRVRDIPKTYQDANISIEK